MHVLLEFYSTLARNDFIVSHKQLFTKLKSKILILATKYCGYTQLYRATKCQVKSVHAYYNCIDHDYYAHSCLS